MICGTRDSKRGALTIAGGFAERLALWIAASLWHLYQP